jgi:uncharacterized protein (TIGR04141 family)
MAKNNSVAIILIKPEFSNYEDIVRDDISGLNSFDVDNLGTVFFVNSEIYPPTWASSFFLDNDNFKSKLWNSSSKATLLIRMTFGDIERIFALIFGRGGSLINDTTIEDRFGLKTALNLIGEKNIRNISKTVIGGSQKNSVEQMPKQSTIDEFEIDIDTDLINKVTGKVAEGKFIEGTVTGSDALLVKHPVDIFNVKDFLSNVYNCYLSKEYLTSFEWIDRVKVIKDKVLVNLLDQQLVLALSSAENEFWMAVPEIIEWDIVKGFRISGVRDEIFDDIYIEKVLGSLRDSLSSIDQLKNKQIYLVDLNDQSLSPWTAYKCLYGELSYSGHSYCINSGKWYEIDRDYSSRIEEQYAESLVSDIDFIEYSKGLREEEYNLSFAQSSIETYICLDKKLIQLGSSHNSIEICDVLSKNNQLIHIKKYSGSSVLSHLFNQGFVSATLLKKGDSSFIMQANEKVSKLTDKDEFKLSPNNNYEIVYGIISKENNNIPNIPFFSKISFCNIRDKLKLYGFKCSIKSIRKEI